MFNVRRGLDPVTRNSEISDRPTTRPDSVGGGVSRDLRLASTLLLGALLAACSIQVPSPGGRLVDLHGHRVEVATAGTGSPTIVLESGGGNGMEAWGTVYQAFAKRTHVFAYSRPGYGRSEWTGAPRDAATVTQELHQLLEAAGEHPPYLLLGHSLGGLYVQAYAARYPGEVAGLVLIDSTPPNHIQKMEAEAPRDAKWLASVMAASPDPLQAELRALTNGQLGFREPPYPGPVIFLVADRPDSNLSPQYPGFHEREETDMATRYAAAELRHVDSHHYIQRERPQTVIAAVDDILNKRTRPE